jgi:uncharacterized protein
VTASGDEVIGFLSAGAAYGLPGAQVGRVETHCSIVFLVGNRAYKLKRPIAFSSLDYTTLARREAACRAELALNRRTAPELYLGVRAIRRRSDGALGFDGKGETLDWVVAMQRFDQPDVFDHLADAHPLAQETIVALAEEIAHFHAAAERVAGLGGAAGLRAAIERNRIDQETVAAILDPAAVAALHRLSLAALDRVAPLLDRRQAEGWVRRCHGDLRLANICLFDGRPTLFDAIEFSEQVSCVDVLYDLAFLLMDLHHRGQEAHANLLFNRYLDATGDSGGLAALPLLLSVRAATRAYALAGSVARQAHVTEAQHHRAAARSHLALAAALLDAAPARIVAIGGVTGSRKTAVAYGLAAGLRPAPGARVLRASAARRRLLGVPPDRRLSAAAFDAATTARVYDDLAAQAVEAATAGAAAVIDASFIEPRQRQAIAAAAADAGVPFAGIWLGAAQDLAGDAGWHALSHAPGIASTIAAARLLAQAS